MVNVASLVWRHADSDPERVAVMSPTERVSYRELRDANAYAAGAVRRAGLAPLDRVVLVAPSVPEFPKTYYGLHAAGVTVVTMNTMSTPTEVGYALDDADVSLVIAWQDCAAAAEAAAGERGIPFWRLTPGGGLEGAPDGAPSYDVYDHEPLDTAVILYTSGTTGRPKGAELTAANLVDTTASFVPVLDITPDDRFGTGLPLFHVFGQCVCMNTTLVNGASFGIISPFHPVDMIEMIKREQLTTVSGVPTMWNAMLHVPGYGPEDFAALRMASSGGASMPVEVMRAFQERFDCAILEGYGLTETCGATSFNDLHKPAKPGTVGPALPGTSIEIRDADGRPVPTGEVGEVFIKGPTVMKGYWNRPDATAADLKDGWLRTGDLGTLDEDGYLSIVDRVKDLIIRGGYNVYPREVEEVLYEHPDVVEAAVVGVPDTHYGEEIAAVVVLAPGSTATGDDLKAWTKERLSAYKVPRLYQFVDALPKGSTGKILKRQIDRSGLAPRPAARTATTA
ncbi:long-chain fatty acid--CoA ligase [Nocardioides sp. KR10-350]|uniref:long-chain-fatty-acid--CoA ligase n=1 Tax=Nocardioides cheoyonin TaxID=3156615 RepID=UPI0032B35925